jgi:hypothetical protein
MSMPVTPETFPDALAPHQVLRHNYRLLARRFAMFFCIFGFLMVLPVILGKLGAPNTFWAAFPAFPGIIGMVFTVHSFAGRPLRLRKCKKILNQYPLESSPHARLTKPVRINRETCFVFDVMVPGSEEPHQVVAVDVQGRGKQPKGADDGVYIAGDLAFGGVIVVPGSNALLLMRPEPWDDAGPKRNAAAPDRRERAKKAGIELIPF